MRVWALNDKRQTVAVPEVSSVDEALDMVAAWNADEDRPHMIVTTVEASGTRYPVPVQGRMF